MALVLRNLFALYDDYFIKNVGEIETAFGPVHVTMMMFFQTIELNICPS